MSLSYLFSELFGGGGGGREVLKMYYQAASGTDNGVFSGLKIKQW